MIAIVNNFHPHTGIGKYAFGLLKQLNERGRGAEMLYLESRDNAIPEASAVKKIRQGMHYPVANRTLAAYFAFPKGLPPGYDLYHVSSQYLARVAKFRKPCIITHMDLAPVVFPGEYPLFLRLFVRRMLKFYDEASLILAISEAGRKELLEYMDLPDDRVRAIPLGVDASLYKPMVMEACRRSLGLPLGKKIVLNVGSEEPRKNIPLLLEAQRSVQSEFGDDALLVRVGARNPGYDGLKKGVNMMHFSNVAEEKMPLFYNSADAFAFPAKYEGGFAYPPLESMACGTPTLVTGALGLFRGGARILPEEASAFSEAITSILSGKCRQLSKSAIETSKKFTLAIEAEKTWKAYQDVLSASR